MGCFPAKNKITNTEHDSNTTVQCTLNAKTRDFKIKEGMLIQEMTGDPYEFYEEVKLLGEGSFGKVFKVRHKTSNVYRAMKLIMKDKIAMGSEEEKALIKEINILKSLDHPNIIKVYQYFNTQRKLYIISELCTGGELFDKISSSKYFNEKLAAHVMKQLLSAVQFCHENGIIHRDLKPENILIESEEEARKDFFTIKVIDFGTSDIVKKGAMQEKQIGTPFYIAPEVLNNSYNEKCDLWSCGVIMYILLGGVPPFYGETDDQIYAAVKLGKVSFEATEWDEVSHEAKDLIRCLLCKDIKKRSSAQEALNHNWFKKMKNNINDIDVSSAYINKIAKNLKGFRANQKLQQATLAYIVHNLTKKEDCEKLRECFIKFDQNGDGRLTKDELLNGLICVMDPIEAKEEVSRIMELVDVDGNGYIEYEEFLRASLDKEKILTQENIQAVFKMFDKDGSGKISPDELKQVLGQDANIDDQVWSQIVGEIDHNGDGEISFGDFNKMMNLLIEAAQEGTGVNLKSKRPSNR